MAIRVLLSATDDDEQWSLPLLCPPPPPFSLHCTGSFYHYLAITLLLYNKQNQNGSPLAVPRPLPRRLGRRLLPRRYRLVPTDPGRRPQDGRLRVLRLRLCRGPGRERSPPAPRRGPVQAMGCHHQRQLLLEPSGKPGLFFEMCIFLPHILCCLFRVCAPLAPRAGGTEQNKFQREELTPHYRPRLTGIANTEVPVFSPLFW